MEDKFCSEDPFYWNLEWLFHISCSRDIISQCVKSACFVEFNLNVSNGTGGWYPLNIYYVVVALVLRCVTLHTKTIICEIGCSFTGTSDELKPNHNVIHSILFLCAFYANIFPFHACACNAESEIICGLNCECEYYLLICSWFDVRRWMNALKEHWSVR